MRFPDLAKSKSISNLPTPGPNMYDLTFYWKGKVEKKASSKVKEWNNVSKGIAISFPFCFYLLIIISRFILWEMREKNWKIEKIKLLLLISKLIFDWLIFLFISLEKTKIKKKMNRVCFKKSILKAIEELNEIIILGSIIQIIQILGNDILKDVQRILLQSDFLLTIGLNQKKKKTSQNSYFLWRI